MQFLPQAFHALEARAEGARADARQQARKDTERNRIRRLSPHRPVEPDETRRVRRGRAGEQFAAGDIERRPVPPQAARRPGETGRRHSLAAQHIERRRQAGAGVSRIAVGRIVDPGLGFLPQHRLQAAFRDGQQRADEAQAATRGGSQILDQRHGGQAVAAAAGGKPQQYGRRLILQLVAAQKMKDMMA